MLLSHVMQTCVANHLRNELEVQLVFVAKTYQDYFTKSKEMAYKV